MSYKKILIYIYKYVHRRYKLASNICKPIFVTFGRIGTLSSTLSSRVARWFGFKPNPRFRYVLEGL
jgi:hypothetical protein